MADTNTSAPYAVAMGMLKASLGYYGAELDASIETYLGNLICYAERALTDDCGLTLVLTDPYDAGLIAMYAAWLYRKGAEGVANPLCCKRLSATGKSGRRWLRPMKSGRRMYDL